jgi:small subunit ribosomal protein S16
MRLGRKKSLQFRIVAVDSRQKRDGAYLELLGTYHPRFSPAKVEIEEEKAMRWLQLGAVPSDTVRNLLSERGIMLKFDLLKRNASAEKIAQVTTEWQAKASQRMAMKAVRVKPKSKKKAASESTAATKPQES